jgi:hypothetical protein
MNSRCNTRYSPDANSLMIGLSRPRDPTELPLVARHAPPPAGAISLVPAGRPSWVR